MSKNGSYVLITPTRDEEKTIGETVKSVVSQQRVPAEWVIVSDGSTDRTDELIEEAAREHPWIRLIKLPPRDGRCFGAVTRATRIALENLTVSDYQYIGLLDSDLRFDPDYFEKVIQAFEEDSKLGVAGGRVIDPGENTAKIPDNLVEVPGAVQFFSRACFESLREIYVIPEGGWDTLTTAEARMNGFRTRLLPNLVVDHLKPRNIGEGGIMKRRWQLGVREYVIGYHPIFQAVKCIRKIGERPFFFSALARWMGFLCALVTRRPRSFPADLTARVRSEQMQRLKNLLKFRAVTHS